MASFHWQPSLSPQILALKHHFCRASSPSLVPCKNDVRICGCGAVPSGRWSSPSSHPQPRDVQLLLRCSWPSSKPLAAVGHTTMARSHSTEASIGLEEMDSVHSEEDKGINEEVDAETFNDKKMVRICDKLIEVFLVDKPRTTDWRKLLAFSKEWGNIRPHFYKRCQVRADGEVDPGMKHKLLRLGRKLKEVDDDVQRHNELLKVIKLEPTQITEIISRRRKDFTREFFEHLHTVVESYYETPTEQNVLYVLTAALQVERSLVCISFKHASLIHSLQTALAKLGNTCLAAVQAYDSASESIEALNAAELKFQDIIDSPTLDVACKKIDTLAEKKELDSALMLMLTKAWSAAKESSMVKDEAKDILYHLYMTARGNLQRLMPKEIRILKYLLTVEDPEERTCALKDAFTPGDEIEGKDVDALYTTPETLFTWIRTVVDAYHFSREGTLIKEARDLMNPKVIKRMEELQKLIQDKFM